MALKQKKSRYVSFIGRIYERSKVRNNQTFHIQPDRTSPKWQMLSFSTCPNLQLHDSHYCRHTGRKSTQIAKKWCHFLCQRRHKTPPIGQKDTRHASSVHNMHELSFVGPILQWQQCSVQIILWRLDSGVVTWQITEIIFSMTNAVRSCYCGGMRWLQSKLEKTCHFRQLRRLLPCPSVDWCHHWPS